MAYQDLKLVTKLAQKQVLTPGLVQMVSLLTLNKLELTEMIQQELVQNPVLEEGTEIVENTTAEIDLDQEAPDQSPESDGTDAEYQALSEAAARDHCVTEPEPAAESSVEVAASRQSTIRTATSIFRASITI
jgi:DNA-directed RNA polymerase specialized sigma54-like protein